MICAHFYNLNMSMNVLVICRLRTRSTYFLKTICDYYDLHNYNEDYFTLPSSYSCALQYNNAHNSIFDKRNQEKWKKYIQKFEDRTNYYFSQSNFGIKLFSKMISSHPLFLYHDKFQDIKMIPNIEKICMFESYDNIYFLDRDLFDSVSSYVYSLQVGKSIYYKNDKGKVVSFTENLYPNVNSYILDYLIQQKIKKILYSNNIPCTYLDYHEIPDFLLDYKSTQSKNLTKDTKYDYKYLIQNYDELINYTNVILASLEKLSLFESS